MSDVAWRARRAVRDLEIPYGTASAGSRLAAFLASFVLVAAAGILGVRGAVAAEPIVRNLDVRGLQIGGATKLVFDGSDLGANPRLLLPWANGKSTLAAESTPAKAIFTVDVPADAAPGLEQLRLATTDGVTSPLVVGVDRLPQGVFGPKVAAVPAALHGSLAGSTVLETEFTLAEPGEWTIEIEAQRLGAKLRPVLHVFDERRRQLAWAWPTRTLSGDARIVHKFAQAGTYRVQLHDVEYAGQGPGHFRLKIGQWHRADAVFPSAVSRGQPAVVQLVGNLPTSRVDLAASDSTDPREVPWPAGTNASGPRLTVQVSEQPEWTEPTAPDAPRDLPAPPVAVNGRLSVPGEEDRYRLPVTAGTKLKLDAWCERLGANLDLTLTVQDDKGAVLARGDDSPGSADPVLEYAVPANVAQVTLVIADSQGRGHDGAIYRLIASLVTDGVLAGTNDFSLTTPVDRVTPTMHGRAVLPIIAERRGYQGPIGVTLGGVPAALVGQPAEIPDGADGCLVELLGTTPGVLSRFTALGTSRDGTLRRTVGFDQHPLAALQPWLRGDLALCVAPYSPFSVEWGGVTADATWTLGGKLALPVVVVRPEGAPTSVRLTLIVAQNVPRVNNNPDLNRAIRLEKPIELTPEQVVGDLVALVPPDLTGPSYDVAVQGELLAADKRVLATSFTTPRRIATLNPVGLQLAATTLEAKLDAKTGAVVKFAGKVERRGAFAGEVTITATGQPGGVKADKITVAAGMDAFEFPVTFPANFKAGDVTGIKLAASGIPDTTKTNQIVRTKDVPITIKLTPADPTGG